MSGQQQNQGKKKKKQQKKKKLSKAERIALRQAQQGGAPKEVLVQYPDDKQQYGKLSLCQSGYQTNRVWVPIKNLTPELAGKQIWIRGRAHAVTGKGKICFVIMREAFATVQVCAAVPDVPKEMVKFMQKIPPESIIDVFGVVQDKTDSPITKTSLSTVEITVQKCFTVSEVTAKQLPFEVADASRSDADIKRAQEQGQKFANVNPATRLDYRYLDLRTPANQGIMRIKSGVARYFRDFLTAQGFTQIWSPKILGGASEGGCEVFKLQPVEAYSWKEACLAQSPQLYKQMGVGCDLDRVFEIGPVFRAENSLTHRHLCEFVGLDLEMSIKEHYHEFLELAGQLFNYIFTMIHNDFAQELEAVNAQYPFEKFLWREDPLILTFKESMEILAEEKQRLLEAGQTEEDIDIWPDANDFNTRMEKTLGRIVREKYKTDFFIVDKYYMSARPFYTMPDPYDPELSNSYDFFIRGEEIMSGAQRVHDPEMLVRACKAKGVPPETIQGYIDCFKYGCPPHAGGGVGLDRVAMLFLGLDNIRKASMFPRDPKRCTP